VSRRIATMLDEPEHVVTKLISALEDKNGYPSHDARLIAESIQKIRRKVSKLGLDPDDTTAAELYHALLARFEKDSQAFEARLGQPTANFDQRTALAARLVSQNQPLPKQWALKNTVARNVLRQHPPKKLMKHLKYRSLESLLKREPLASIYLGSQIHESASWQSAHEKLISKLRQTDFELRDVKIIALDYEKWTEGSETAKYVISNPAMAAIAISPSRNLKEAPALTLIILLLEELKDEYKTNLSRALIKISPTIGWWVDLDHLVANLNSEHVSLSIADNALNSLNNNVFVDRTLERGRKSFWKELISRYHNLPAQEASFDYSVREKVVSLKFNPPEPAYEFVEDF
jgi:hypothetical protein